MKDHFFEMLLSLFEQTLTQLKEKEPSDNDPRELSEVLEKMSLSLPSSELEPHWLKSAQESSMRVLTYDEQMKLTKASYQFLMRLSRLEIIDSHVLEVVLNQLVASDSRFVTLEETKWTLRNILAEGLDAKQLAFLDLVLYQKEDAWPLH
jgi:Smg protein